MKLCSKCQEWKNESEFNKNRSRKDGLRVWCKKCTHNYTRGHLKRYLKYEERHRTIHGMKQKRCSKCKKWKDESGFSMDVSCKDRLSLWCKDCCRKYNEQKRGVEKKYRNYKDLHRVTGGVKQKQCGRCKKWKDETQYYKHSQYRDGLALWCKACANKATNKARKKRRAALRN